MARAELRAGRRAEEIGEAIVAAWFAGLPVNPGESVHIDLDSLSVAFSNILYANCVAVLDLPGDPQNNVPPKIHIPVPYPPRNSAAELIQYLHHHYEESLRDPKNPFNPNKPNKDRQRKFSDDMGQALFFGCGK